MRRLGIHKNILVSGMKVRLVLSFESTFSSFKEMFITVCRRGAGWYKRRAMIYFALVFSSCLQYLRFDLCNMC